jgi:ribose 5-phosphate isomerase B
MRIGIAADHAGFELKSRLLERLRAASVDVVDYGACFFEPTDDFPDRVAPLAMAVSRGDLERGIAVCGSGVGACIVANKFKDVRAALIMDVYSAVQGVEHDDMNVMCLGSRVLGDELAWALTLAYVEASFNGADRHNRRLQKIKQLEVGFPATPPAGDGNGPCP